MAILQILDSRERDLGGFVVRRVLPAAKARMVGPFIFFDHLGPAQFGPGGGMDVRPHPHIALATVTYLFEGAIEHRDSLGSVRRIEPGDVNWMTAGRGITHSERTPAALRPSGPRIEGIQSWVALPDGCEDIEPSFVHHPAASLPRLTLDGTALTVIAGTAYGAESPVATLWPTLYVHAQLPAQASLALPERHGERAIYVAHGAVKIGDAPVAAGQLAMVPENLRSVEAQGEATLMLLGGDPFPTPRFIDWNFVASSRERIEHAKTRWRSGGFPAVPGDPEFIPLTGD